ncbi:MAG: MauE/DoxX family redox-associated membrane protein [Chthoniobacterales bacterium]
MEDEKVGTSSIEIGLRWLLGGLFVFAGVLKALDPATFADDIANYQLLPWTGAVAGAFYLPWLEIFSGVALVSGVWKSGAIRILLLLMLAFLQALFAAWLRGLNIHCGCFGQALATSNYALLFLRDAAILAGLLWLLWAEWKRRIAEEAIAENEPSQI